MFTIYIERTNKEKTIKMKKTDHSLDTLFLKLFSKHNLNNHFDQIDYNTGSSGNLHKKMIFNGFLYESLIEIFKNYITAYLSAIIHNNNNTVGNETADIIPQNNSAQLLSSTNNIQQNNSNDNDNDNDNINQMKNNKKKKDLLNREIIGFVGYAINRCKKLVVYKDHKKIQMK